MQNPSWPFSGAQPADPADTLHVVWAYYVECAPTVWRRGAGVGGANVGMRITNISLALGGSVRYSVYITHILCGVYIQSLGPVSRVHVRRDNHSNFAMRAVPAPGSQQARTIPCAESTGGGGSRAARAWTLPRLVPSTLPVASAIRIVTKTSAVRPARRVCSS